MAEKIFIVGVDVSKDSLDIAFVLGKEKSPKDLGKFSNKKKGFSSLAKKLQKAFKEAECDSFEVIVEPTGGYEKLFVKFCINQDWKVKVVVPYRVRQWAKSQGKRAKTDAMDARVLALYGANHKLPDWTFLPEEVEKLDNLLQRIDQIDSHLRQEENRRHSLKAKEEYCGPVAESVERLILMLKEELANLHKNIDKHLGNHPHLKEEQDSLRELPGVGKNNSLPLLAFLHQFYAKTSGQGNAKGIAAFAGLDPSPYESGSSVHKRRMISRQGNPKIRKILYLGVIGGMRSKDPNNPLKLFVERLKGRGKKSKVAFVAAARKILVWAWMIFKNGTHFDPQKAVMSVS